MINQILLQIFGLVFAYLGGTEIAIAINSSGDYFRGLVLSGIGIGLCGLSSVIQHLRELKGEEFTNKATNYSTK